jgi:hypothetical protein
MLLALNMKTEMIITYTEHAKTRMAFREISKAEVEQAISEPYFALPSRLGREIIVKRQGAKYLKIICERSNDKITVVTVYWTRRP